MTEIASGKIGLTKVQAGDSQNFWMLPNDYGSIPAGLYITKQSIDSFKTNPSDSNIFMNSSRGIFIRNGSYNQIVLQAGATDPSLRLYAPGGTGSEGELSVELTGGTNPVLNLYKIQGTTHTIAATLNTQGLTLKDGGIRGGDPNTSDFIYLSTNDYTGTGSSAITINGNSSNWRLIAGTQFGVTNTGAIYGENVHLTGEIVAKSGRIGAASDGTGGWTIDSNKLYNGTLNSSNEITHTNGTVDDTMFLSTINLKNNSLYPIGKHTVTSDEVNTEGWRLTVGSGFGVTNLGHLFATGAQVSGALTATSLSTGNRTGSGTGTAGTYIDSSGNIYVGADNDFIIYANGSFYAKSGTISGSLIVEGTSNISGTLSAELQAAAQKAANFLKLATVDNVYGLKAAPNVSSATSYAFIHAGGLKVYNGGTDVASFGATSRIGDEDGTHVFIDNGGLKFYHGDDFKGQLLYWGLDEGNLRLGVGDSAQYANITEYSVGTTESRIIMTAAGTINGYNSQMTIRINNDCIVTRGIANTFYTISGNANIAPVGTILDAHSHYVPAVQWGSYDPLTQSSSITAKVGDIYIKTS